VYLYWETNKRPILIYVLILVKALRKRTLFHYLENLYVKRTITKRHILVKALCFYLLVRYRTITKRLILGTITNRSKKPRLILVQRELILVRNRGIYW